MIQYCQRINIYLKIKEGMYGQKINKLEDNVWFKTTRKVDITWEKVSNELNQMIFQLWDCVVKVFFSLLCIAEKKTMLVYFFIIKKYTKIIVRSFTVKVSNKIFFIG